NFTGTIQPHSSAIIWFQSSSSRLTAADFNAKFGTNLTEGENLIIIKASKPIPTAKPVQLELLLGTSVINRIWYNWGENSSEVKPDKAITFEYNHLFSQTSVQTSNSAAPTPGNVSSSQVPTAVTK
ncbi:MAG TPA: hypothetical protein GXX42_03225, partial [Petrimonas sp.]|uniref:hypothetical protein n=1 Tax=Petrimonas sp. TaxID=2023866 RepID=UPI0017507AB4|nr:hypothetical protein [Petrimonas sp.]